MILSQITAPDAVFKRRVINAGPLPLVLVNMLVTQFYVQKVALVGKFSQSRYLQDSLRRSLQQVGDIRVLVPHDP